MAKSFKIYLDDLEQPGIIFTFGRFQPPGIGHYLNAKFINDYAKKHKIEGVIYTSQIHNSKKNPLVYSDKLFFLEQMVKDLPYVRISRDNVFKNAFQILEDLIQNKKYKRIVFAVGEDRVNDFQNLYKYAKIWDPNVSFKIVNTGSRTEGISGTDMRNYVKNNNFKKFKEGLPSTLKKYSKELFEKVKIGLKG